jgi:uncharacterized lipoprotein YajG
MKTIAIMIAAILVLSGCATTPDDRLRLPVMYGTLKLIENSEDVTAAGVLRYTDRARELINLNAEIDVRYIAEQLLAELMHEQLSPADRFLVQALIEQIDTEFTSLKLRVPDSALTLLDVVVWIEQAAKMSGGN